jgi:hypothetical protein
MRGFVVAGLSFIALASAAAAETPAPASPAWSHPAGFFAADLSDGWAAQAMPGGAVFTRGAARCEAVRMPSSRRVARETPDASDARAEAMLVRDWGRLANTVRFGGEQLGDPDVAETVKIDGRSAKTASWAKAGKKGRSGRALYFADPAAAIVAVCLAPESASEDIEAMDRFLKGMRRASPPAAAPAPKD